MDWQKSLNTFLSDFEHMADVIGVLVCGSYVTGSPTAHSDLDVHIILSSDVSYRERGNKIVDGLLIEYFANPPMQIEAYMDEDLEVRRLMAHVQFATGKILRDDTGEVAALKEKAFTAIDEFYKKSPPASMQEMTKYGLWDMRDDLQDAHETNRADFDFLYFNLLDNLINEYMNAVNMPYHKKAILVNVEDERIRGKYLLRELPDKHISDLIIKAIKAEGRDEKLNLYEQLTEAVLCRFGGFEIDGFRFRSEVSF